MSVKAKELLSIVVAIVVGFSIYGLIRTILPAAFGGGNGPIGILYAAIAGGVGAGAGALLFKKLKKIFGIAEEET